MLNDLLAVNSLDKDSLAKAAEYNFGLEVVEYLWKSTEDEIIEKREYVPKIMNDFKRFAFHGTGIHRDDAEIFKLSDDELLNIYNEAYVQAYFHKINKIIFHTNYFAEFESQESYLNRLIPFWKRFLQDKPADIKIYIENLADQTPDLLLRLCDAIDDIRIRICLDTGHACCNSKIDVADWIKKLGKRIEHMHLHNNDGLSDKHWALGKGILDDKKIIELLLEHTNSNMIVLECNFEESLAWLLKNNLITENKK